MAHKWFDYLAFVLMLTGVIKLKEVDSSHELSKRQLMPGYRLNNEKRLIDDLFKNYQVKFGRPVNNMSEQVIVYFGIYLIQIVDLVKTISLMIEARLSSPEKIILIKDERNQVLISNVKSIYEWKDNGLKWNKSLYGNVEDINLPVERIWTPDVVLYNYADTRLEEKREVLATVSSDGTVKWRPPAIFKSTCQINIVQFPYDRQNCSMKFGSWTYGGDSIDIRFYGGLEEVNTNEYIESNEWEVLSKFGKRTEKKYECCKEVFPDITFSLLIKRKGGFYSYILVLPCVLLSCLTTVLFWLPPESPAKMVLGMNIFTSFFVLLLLLSKNVPSASDKIPLIGSYYCLNMVMIATSTCSCTAVVHIFYRGQGQVPTIIRKIFLEFLARIFCMITPPMLPPVQEKRSKMPQPATIITSVNNPANQTNGNLQHHINRVSGGGNVMGGPPPNNRLSQQQLNSASCTALNQPNDEANQMLNQSLPAYGAYPQSGFKSSEYMDMGAMSSGYPGGGGGFGQYQTLPSGMGQGRSSSYHHAYHRPSTLQHNQQLSTELNLSFNLIENDIKEIRDYLRHTRKKLENTDAKAKQTNEWKQVALVLDRTLFFIYIIATIVSVIAVFPR